MQLVEMSQKHRPAFTEMLEEYNLLGEKYVPFEIGLDRWWSNVDEYIQFWQPLAVQACPDLGLARMENYWLIDEAGSVLGDSRLRPELDDELMYTYGHIGYNVRPTARGQGIATIVLRLTVDRARVLGLNRLLLICDQDNVASIRVIEKNGGTLYDKFTKHDGTHVCRYWVTA